MDRKNFLKGVGMVCLGAAALPVLGLTRDVMDEPSNNDLLARETSCTAIPEETAGPYPLPSGVSTTSLVRSDITEGTQPGIPLTLTLTITNTDMSCAPISGLRVDIWQCNKRGYYSAYDGQPGIDGTENYAGTTWLRGIQYTNSAGQVTFTSIYPGWYSPRATHIHVEVYNGTTLLATTQVCFPDAINTTVNTYYATSGANPTTNETDMVFSDSYSQETLTVSGDTTAGYTASAAIPISAGTSLGVQELSVESGGQFGNLTNYPDPFSGTTIISFYLIQASEVSLTISDMAGRTVKRVSASGMAKGTNTIEADMSDAAAGIYLYQLQVSNQNGTFRQTKKMVKD
jgi:protocatechuate 3,4-dioxygenase beta subunit